MITHGHCSVPVVGDNTVASWLLEPGTSTLWISTIAKDVEGAGMLFLFAFAKMAVTLT